MVVLSYTPHDIDIYNRVFNKEEDAIKCFNKLVRDSRITAYGIDNNQGYLGEGGIFEMLVEEEYGDYEIKITIEKVELENRN